MKDLEEEKNKWKVRYEAEDLGNKKNLDQFTKQ